MAGTIVPHLPGGSPAAYARELHVLERDAQRHGRPRPGWVGWLGAVLASAGLLAGLVAVLPLLPDHDGPDTPATTAPAGATILASPPAARDPAHASAARRGVRQPAG